ncbi:hypothetical protein E5D57_013066 [Metarhizium anisopliae]|nr:hypothetical protein E5D57_013066 [Metarhizium anisopliae]
MRFATPVTLLAAISGTCAMVIQRDNPLAKCINSVTSSLNKLDVATKSFNGDIQPVVEAADNVIATIQHGQMVTDGTPSIGLFSAAALLQPVQILDNRAKVLFVDVKGRVLDVQKAKKCDVTRAKLSTLNSVGHKLIDTILNKISSGFARNIARPFTDDIKGLLAKSLDLFEGARCVDAY